MTLTYNILTRTVARNRRLNVVEVTFDSSYPAGGETLSANSLGLNTIESLVVGSSDDALQASWQRSSSKLKIHSPGGGAGVVTKAVTRAGMTDNGDTTGYIDMATGALPASAIPLGWKLVTTTGFTGDTTAVAMVGVSGDTDRFSAQTNGSCLAAGTVGSAPIAADALDSIGTAQTPRLTITGGADFTNIAAGAATLFFYYLDTVAASSVEIPDTTDLSTLVCTLLAIGT